MVQRAGRRNQPGSGETGWIVLGGFLALAMVLVVGWWGAALLDSSITGPAAADDPITIITGQITGTLPVMGLQIAVFSVAVVLVLGLTLLLVIAGLRQRGKSSRVDHLARSMSRPKDLNTLSVKAQTATSEKLRATGASAGVPLARSVATNKELRASWEWVQTWIMGPRAGKPRASVSLRSSKPTDQCSRRRISETLWTSPGSHAPRRVKCGSTTRKTSSVKNPRGSGTR